MIKIRIPVYLILGVGEYAKSKTESAPKIGEPGEPVAELTKFGWISGKKTSGHTGGPSSSCEMIILRNNGHGGIIRVCMGIFTTALRNKTIRQILNKNTSPYFHSVSLVI